MKPKILSEKETRTKIFALAKLLGCDPELRIIFNRYDKLIKNCGNEQERNQIAVLANVEVHRLLNFRNPLVVDGQEIIPADPSWDEQEKS